MRDGSQERQFEADVPHVKHDESQFLHASIVSEPKVVVVR